MGMHPNVEIVLGIEVLGEEKKTETRGTKYREDTGKPYTVVSTKTEYVLPDWLDKLVLATEEDDHGHVKGTLAAFDDFNCGQQFFVGKLLGLISPRDFDSGIIEETADDVRKVWEWLQSVGCDAPLEDVKIRLRSIWF